MSDDIGISALGGLSSIGLPAGADSQKKEQQEQRSGARGASGDTLRLSPEAEKAVQKLQQRDREVRAHEQAHIAAGGQHAGGASFTYQNGPDGRQYAIGGSVPIDTSPVPDDPEATEEKARTVRRAALAPANPSAADQAIAAKATAMETKARTDKMKEDAEGEDGGDGDAKSVGGLGEGAEEARGISGEAKISVDAASATERARAASAYERVGSTEYGVSWQSSAGRTGRDPVSSAHAPWPGPERAAAIYAAAQAGSQPVTALAPWGTGISAAV